MTDDHHTTTEDAAAQHDVKLTPFLLLRYCLSLGLLVFSCILVGALIFTGNTRVAKDTNSWVALIVCVSGRQRLSLSSRVSVLGSQFGSLFLSVVSSSSAPF